MKNDMIESIMDSYMRRGLLRIVFSESIDTPERRVNLIDMKAVFVVPCRIAEDKKKWKPSKKAFWDAAQLVHGLRAEKARQIWSARSSL